MKRRNRYETVDRVYRMSCATIILLAAGFCIAGAVQTMHQTVNEPVAACAAAEKADKPTVEIPELPTESVTVSRYADVSGEECELMAKVVYLEARGESLEGQQAVAEVILNRVASEGFPDSVEDVIFEGQDGVGAVQFVTAAYLDTAEPTAEQYAAVGQALYGEAILPMDVVYFSTSGENDRVWGRIGGHIFCYQYEW